MAWVTPKTNWAITDYFNIEDYTRIVGNLKYIKDYLETMYAPVNLANMADTKTYSSFLYASEVNAIENNLAALNEGTYNYDIGETKEYVQNGHTPDFEELNRIESAILKLKETLEAQYKNIPRLSFTLGLYRGLQV